MKAKEQHSKQKGKSTINNRRYKQHWAHKTQKDDNQNKGTTQQTEGKVNNRESKDTGNIGHKTERSQTKQKHNTEN